MVLSYTTHNFLVIFLFFQQNLLLRWCPAPGCDFAIKVDYSPVKPISCECKCGHEFCFDCGENWHGPVPCDLLKRFNDHIREGIFRPFMLRHMDYDSDDRIKTCPNPACKVSIQKIFGCPVMVSDMGSLVVKRGLLFVLISVAMQKLFDNFLLGVSESLQN